MLATLALLPTTAPPSTGRIELISQLKAVQAGRPFTVAIRLEPAPGYHTYWINPGDSGSPTTINWNLPKGWRTSKLRFPTPNRISTAGIISYGYEDPATVLTELVPPETLKGKSVTLTGRVGWLTCTSQMCAPANGNFSLKLSVATKEVDNPAFDSLLTDAAKNMPRPLSNANATAHLDGRTVLLSLKAQLEKPGNPYFFPDAPGMISHSKPQSFTATQTELSGRLPVSEYAVKPPTRLSGVLKAPAGNAFAGGVKAVLIDVPITRPQEKSHA